MGWCNKIIGFKSYNINGDYLSTRLITGKQGSIDFNEIQKKKLVCITNKRIKSQSSFKLFV